MKNNIDHLADPNGDNSLSSIKASYDSSSSYVWARILLFSQPKVEKQQFRSLDRDFLVIGGWSPHSGCTLSYVKNEERKYVGSAFFDPCLGLFFDVAGRVLSKQLTKETSNVLKKYNLFIPPYRFKDDKTIQIGISESDELPELIIPLEQHYLNMTATEKLIHAARYNDFETIKTAIINGADINYSYKGHARPIDAAIIGSSIEIINFLLEKGAKPTDHSVKVAEFTGRDAVVFLLKKYK